MKTKALLQFLFAVLISTSLFAQNEEKIADGSFAPWYSYDENQKELYCYVLVTDANVRAQPKISAATVAKLPIATKVKIEEVSSDSLSVSGFKAPWCKVSYTLAGQQKQSGYIWGGMLAFVMYELQDEYDQARNGLVYLAGVSSVDTKKNKWTLQMRVAKNGVELAKTEFQSQGDVGYSAALLSHGSLEFKNVTDVIELKAYYPACGYASSESLLFFTKNNKLHRGLETSDIADGGVFYANEDYILPNQTGGIYNHIMVVNTSAEFDSKDLPNGEYESVLKEQQYSIQIYKWLGDKLMKVKELK